LITFTAKHNSLAIVNDATILKLVARTGNFVPTPSANQIVFHVNPSPNYFCIRLYKSKSQSIYWDLITQEAEEARSAGLVAGDPEFFIIPTLCSKGNAIFLYSYANNMAKSSRTFSSFTLNIGDLRIRNSIKA
jgi:hypothetical protein